MGKLTCLVHKMLITPVPGALKIGMFAVFVTSGNARKCAILFKMAVFMMEGAMQ